MWEYVYEETAELPPEALWPVLAGIADWPEVDRQIERIEVDGPIRVGTRFGLKVKGGPLLRLEVTELEPPGRYADRCRLPGARMWTRHELIPSGTGTRIRVTLRFEGRLASLWARLVGRRHARGLRAQTARFVERAKRLARSSSS